MFTGQSRCFAGPATERRCVMQPSDLDKFDRFADEHPVGTDVSGVVTHVAPFGVFCRLADGVHGLMFVHEFGGPHTRFPDEFPQLGETMLVRINFMNREQRKLTLSKRPGPAA